MLIFSLLMVGLVPTAAVLALVVAPAAAAPDLALSIAMVIGTALASLLTAIATQVLRRLNLQLTAQRQAEIEHVVGLAITRVEEFGANYLRRHGFALDASQKLQMAVTEIVGKIPRIDRAEAEAIVHALLPAMGLGATAALGKLTAGLATPRPTPPATE